MKLSKNLSLAEVTKSTTAKRLGIDNTPDEWVTENLKKVAEHIFQPVRDHFGRPIFVSSGYRSPDLNVAIGGSKRSQHVEGRALDNLISSFGSLVMKTILIGFTCLSFMMVLIVSGASKLFEMIEAKFITK